MTADPKALIVSTSQETIGSPRQSESDSPDENGYDHRKNPFKEQTAAEHWRKVYEKSSYECRHVFDPSFTWSEEEEKRLVRKLDWRVCLWAVGTMPLLFSVVRSR